MLTDRIIIIDNNGKVSVPLNVKMRDFEIANLLGVSYPLVCSRIKTLLKSGRYQYFGGGVVVGNGMVVQDYFGLDIVIAVAFQVDSYESDLFRKCIMKKVVQSHHQPLYIGISDMNNMMLN